MLSWVRGWVDGGLHLGSEARCDVDVRGGVSSPWAACESTYEGLWKCLGGRSSVPHARSNGAVIVIVSINYAGLSLVQSCKPRDHWMIFLMNSWHLTAPAAKISSAFAVWSLIDKKTYRKTSNKRTSKPRRLIETQRLLETETRHLLEHWPRAPYVY